MLPNLTKKIDGQEKPEATEPHGFRRVLLKLPVYFDALRINPRLWLVAFWWRLLRKRVRSRAQFAPLLSASPRSYNLWLLSEPSLSDPCMTAQGAYPPIVAIVSEGERQADTLNCFSLQSLRQTELTVLALGTSQTPDIIAALKYIDWDTAPWLLPLKAGDTLAPGAVNSYRIAAMETASRGGRLVYADDDLIDPRGQRVTPHFKTEWNGELQSHFDFLTGACILNPRPDELAELTGPDWAERLVEAIAQDTIPCHLPYVLHHRLARPAPQIPTKAKLGRGSSLPKATIIIPTRNRVDLLRTCIEGLSRTDYPDFEVIVVDNGSDEAATLDYLAALDPTQYRVLRDNGGFNFSRLNNRAAELATGELLCLLNNDIEVLEPDWLTIMSKQALRPEVGAVGAQLLYPDGRIQHAGVVLGICGGAAHAHRLLQTDEEGYFHRHSLPQYVSAVTAACLVVRRECFEAVGGLDEDNFAVAFNDVDLCLRLNQRGWQSFYEPRARLIHHESVSRGFDRDPVGAARMARELAALKARWNTGDMNVQVDRFHHPQLCRYSERFVVQLRGRQ